MNDKSHRYMTQDVFNMCAVGAAKLSAATGQSIESFALKLSEEYGKYYRDTELAKDIALAGKKVTEFMNSQFPPETLVGGLTQIQYCIKHFNTDGSKKPRQIFGGVYFNNEPMQIQKKVEQCAVDVSMFSRLVLERIIPLVPDGWRL